jgi:hypothetical protein
MASDQSLCNADLELERLFLLENLIVCNEAQLSCQDPLTITMVPKAWWYSALIPAKAGVLPGNGRLSVEIEATALSGDVRLAGLAEDQSELVTDEIGLSPDGIRRRIILFVEEAEKLKWIVIRCGDFVDPAPRVQVHAIKTRRGADIPKDVYDVPLAEIPRTQLGNYRFKDSLTFRVFLTHTSRRWNISDCSKEKLAARFRSPDRLNNLPAFESLRPNKTFRLYHGGYTEFELCLNHDDASINLVRCVDSRYKIQYVTRVGQRVVLCLEDLLYVLPSADADLSEGDLLDASRRVDDNWFSGMQTVFAVDEDTCLVSSSGADAVLWVDLPSGKVNRRWRLPESIYGRNYDLTPEMSLKDHFIHNDIQLGHVNCAAPDGAGGFVISTLVQGDIGHLDNSGNYRLLARGFVGCHGAKFGLDRETIFFCDSTAGRLMSLNKNGQITMLWQSDSQWLHDAQQLTDSTYLLCLGDKNELSVVDVAQGIEIARFSFESRGCNVQFLSVIR